jgi:hypothetical protein
MSLYMNIVQFLESYSHMGTCVLDDGTRLICKAEHVAPHAWLHALYAPLSEKEILYLEHMLHEPIPSSYRSLLLEFNGIDLFSSRIQLEGLRKKAGRTIADAWQPFSLITSNTVERPLSMSADLFVIGSYGADGALICINKSDQVIIRTNKTGKRKLAKWDNLLIFLNSESIRLGDSYDADGKPRAGLHDMV